jgi:ABC-type phosphate transport system substrate-binding protein
MMNRRYTRHVVVALTAALVAVSIGLVTKGGSAHGDTTGGTLVGEGGDAMTPVMLSLLNDDASQLTPDTASYTNVNLNQAIADFVGTAPGSFGADFAVSERKLTTAETAAATADGRSYAYVPFAASPVALMTLVPPTRGPVPSVRVSSASTSR